MAKKPVRSKKATLRVGGSRTTIHYLEALDRTPGISRRRRGKGFFYVNSKNRPIRSETTLEWIRKLGIPPAWEDVWISADPQSHLLATGLDAKHRKQYRYHPQWRERQEGLKYQRIVQFARALPKIRKRAKADMRRSGLPRGKVLAAIVLLLEKTRIRVGNEEYKRTNNSYGLTTLQDKHVRISGKSIVFSFVGKSGKRHTIELQDKTLADVVKGCRALPGPDLFQYIDDHGTKRDVTSNDVNAYLREITGEEFSAKDFRTWAGTVLAALALQELERFDSKAHAKRNVMRAIESVAKELGNTPTICKNCYIHPSIIESYMDGSLLEVFRKEAVKKLRASLRGLDPEEAVVLAFLEERLEREVGGRG